MKKVCVLTTALITSACGLLTIVTLSAMVALTLLCGCASKGKYEAMQEALSEFISDKDAKYEMPQTEELIAQISEIVVSNL